jgi:hypothetical protein
MLNARTAGKDPTDTGKERTLPDSDFDKAAAAMVEQHGRKAVQIAELRADRHALANDGEAAELWRKVAEAVRQKIARGQ